MAEKRWSVLEEFTEYEFKGIGTWIAKVMDKKE